MRTALDKLLLNPLTLPRRPFYRRYPFRSAASIRSANDRGMVDFESGFFYNRVPKAANSTVVTQLTRIRFGQDVPSKQAKRLFQTPGHLAKEDIDRFDTLFKFTVVRNPFLRTLSAYLDKIERRAMRHGARSSFRGFVDRLEEDERYLYSNAHWAPQHALMLMPIDAFDFIGKVETLDADLGYIQSRIWPDIAESITSMKANATNAAGKLERYYESDLIERVRTMYRLDFEAFDYEPDLPT